MKVVRVAREMKRKAILIALTLITWTAAANPTRADGFFKDKQIKLVVGADAGGSYDTYARLISRFLPQNIPGEPQIVVQNMPGAASMIAADYVSNAEAQDGTVLLMALQTLVLNQLLRNKNVHFDAGRLQWLGNPAASVNVIVTWHTSPVRTLSDALLQPAAIGVPSAATSGGMELALSNNVLGTKFQAITGYRGGRDIALAMERGEVVGRAGESWDGWKQERPDWVRDKLLNVIVQIGQTRAEDLTDVPLLKDATNDTSKRKILTLYSDAVALGRPIAAGPAVPPGRVAILREAFRRVMNDPRFRAEAHGLGVAIEPTYGEELQSLVTKILAASPDAITAMIAALGITGKD
jgi:tripartite-type tricarboxylate transporter receptor subunit TctC